VQHAAARTHGGWSRCLGGLLLAVAVSLGAWARGVPNDPGRSLQREFNVSDSFFRRVQDRAVIDQYETRSHAVQVEVAPESRPLRARHPPDDGSFRIVVPAVPPRILSHRRAISARVRPLRGFRAPILDDATDRWPVVLPASGLSAPERQVAARIRQSLASEGLLLTLARSLAILGPSRFLTNHAAGVRELAGLGFPVDWLRFFAVGSAAAGRPGDVIAAVARELVQGRAMAAVRAALQAARFHFKPTRAGFRIAAEDGEHTIGLLRMQIGGGYANGIVPGGALDVFGELLGAMPEANVVASVPAEYLRSLKWMARFVWPLGRPGRLVLIAEPLPLSAWAQDNGKAGYLRTPGARFNTPATLVPRYASLNELDSTFCPEESFVMDGVRAAGQVVVHSPLLFQGGNVLVVHDPGRGQRVLLISETDVYRNIALGLTRSEVLDAFRVEFAVDRCVVMPAASYHLDYDLTLLS
jgi:hypothetical protein